MTIASDLINGSMRLVGIIAEGETPTASASNDALLALNQMIDSWSASGLNVFSTQDQTFTWPASTATRTVGATGNLVGTRPVEVDKSTYYILNGISYHLEIITQSQYDSIQQKTASGLPIYMLVNQTMPDTTLTLYPVPSEAIAIHIICAVPLTQPAALGTTLLIPPGYLRYFRFALAIEIAAEFGFPVTDDIHRIAASSMRIIKRMNSKRLNSDLCIPRILTRRYRSNINIG
ncbi:hypothetical protein UFOVP1155_21 [uncultured Caudovirales phage]|uniref:Uncharacterized protein n=1 Tax=uncultured Caudovirales phage TaxID=2100421 RepID=A0A6J5QXV4_9CAUD|nr:hypothetical protein UFOVP1155_21 [uncultured Caudovirales phage]